MKTALRRLEELEQQSRDLLAATDTSGARERLEERIRVIGERMRADPSWRPPTEEESAAAMRDFKAFLATI